MSYNGDKLRGGSVNTKAKESSVPAVSSTKGNVSFTGSGKVSVSVASIVSSSTVQRQVSSVRQIAAIQSGTKGK